MNVPSYAKRGASSILASLSGGESRRPDPTKTSSNSRSPRPPESLAGLIGETIAVLLMCPTCPGRAEWFALGEVLTAGGAVATKRHACPACGTRGFVREWL
jgi:RNA polymerase subunit RPABC4/transcription elongation factor Spt4